MTATERASRSEQICDRIAASEAWQRSRVVLLFAPMRTEPDIAALHNVATQSGKQVAVIPNTVRLESEIELPLTPDLVLVPGLAFTKDGRRLGRGGGFYDRLLAGHLENAWKVGVCFELQLRDEIPQEQHDALVDIVISG
ncbi:MAG: 5-formyltetrahydrofolate cyclo-ligase [Verrucomicrobiota bacterium]|nr:5-formyltetrahydrofolate cyclo-ligase [Verrucomicrobiota bacterium]